MIAEAIDTLWTLWWAFAAWIVAGALVMTAALYATVVVVVLAWHAARWACRGAWRGRGAPERGSCDSSAVGGAERAAHGHTAPHVTQETS